MSDIINTYDNQKKSTILSGVKFQGQSMYNSQFQKLKLEDQEYKFFISRISTYPPLIPFILFARIPLKNNFPFQGISNNSHQFVYKEGERN